MYKKTVSLNHHYYFCDLQKLACQYSRGSKKGASYKTPFESLSQIVLCYLSVCCCTENYTRPQNCAVVLSLIFKSSRQETDVSK